VAKAQKTRYVDVSNPDLAIDCPRCGLRTARFIDQCRNCSYKLWPSSVVASAAFQAWRAVDPSRAAASRFDLEVPQQIDVVIDFAERAHRLGIHLFPNSNWPFIICVGVFFLGFAAAPFPSTARIILAVIGAIVFLWGVIGWVAIEDVRMFPTEGDSSTPHEAHQ
jgi:hypothetical protein